MKKIAYFFLLLVCMTSCSYRYDKLKLIAGDSCQYWYKPTPDSLGKTKYYIYFDRTGKRVILEEGYSDKRYYLYDGDDVAYCSAWSLKNDTIIIWGKKERILTVICDSIIVTEDKEHHIIDTLHKVTNSSLIKKLRQVPIP